MVTTLFSPRSNVIHLHFILRCIFQQNIQSLHYETDQDICFPYRPGVDHQPGVVKGVAVSGRRWLTVAEGGWCAARRSFHQFSHNELPKCQTRAVFSRTGILDYKASALFSSALVLVKPLHHYDQGSAYPGELLLTTLDWFVSFFAGILDIKYKSTAIVIGNYVTLQMLA